MVLISKFRKSVQIYPTRTPDRPARARASPVVSNSKTFVLEHSKIKYYSDWGGIILTLLEVIKINNLLIYQIFIVKETSFIQI